MRILAYDTSGDVLSLGFFDNGKPLAEYDQCSFSGHSGMLVPALEQMLKKRKVSLKDIDLIAVGLGPGSFTGLRVGVTTAKMLAYALKKKLIGISTFDAIARGISDYEGPLAVIQDAKRSNVYAALYEKKQGRVYEREKPCVMTIDGFVSRITTPTLFIADGASYFIEIIKKLKHDHLVGVIDGTLVRPKARAVAEAAIALAGEGKFMDPIKLEPQYLYPRDCNVTKAKKR